MDKKPVAAVQSTRRRIIERPRLTRMLDASPARVRMLIAPAGYGKTTLARQWTGTAERPAVWHVGGPASADVAAIAASIAKAALPLIPGCDERIRQRLSVTKRPEGEVDVLAEIVAEDLAAWPGGTWLVLDEYQFAAESPPSDEFVGRLVDLTQLNVLIASRTRPAWATARKILYGEIFELGRNALAMSDEEAREALSERGIETPGLIALADGWPAVIGLAREAYETLPEHVPAALYDFFAEELYQDLDLAVRQGLWKLALVGTCREELASDLLGPTSGDVVRAGLERGALSTSPNGAIELHPLLQDFLRTKIRSQPFDELDSTLRDVIAFLFQHERWDDAFDMAASLGADALIAAIIERGLDGALYSGRTTSVQTWLEYANASGLDSPIFEIAASELAFRKGRFRKARALAEAAALRLSAPDALRVRSLLLAARASHLDSEEADALDLYRTARAEALSAADERQALWGELSSAIDLDLPEAQTTLDQLAATSDRSVKELVMLADRALILEERTGAYRSLEAGRAAAAIVSRLEDPLLRCSFRNIFSYTLALHCEYEECLALLRDEQTDVDLYRLDFVRPYVNATRAVAFAGMRRFDDALEELARADGHAERCGDTFAALNARAVASRVYLVLGRFEEALRATDIPNRNSVQSIEAELLACRAIAYACLGDSERAQESAAYAEARGRSVEVRTGVACARAIRAIRLGTEVAQALAEFALDVAIDSGNRDFFVSAYRAEPELLANAAATVAGQTQLRTLLRRAGDGDLASLGLPLPDSPPALSRREEEVCGLIAAGCTNREIADRLYISDATVKVHVRHIFEKLGVRSRTSVALRMVGRLPS